MAMNPNTPVQRASNALQDATGLTCLQQAGWAHYASMAAMTAGLSLAAIVHHAPTLDVRYVAVLASALILATLGRNRKDQRPQVASMPGTLLFLAATYGAWIAGLAYWAATNAGGRPFDMDVNSGLAFTILAWAKADFWMDRHNAFARALKGGSIPAPPRPNTWVDVIMAGLQAMCAVPAILTQGPTSVTLPTSAAIALNLLGVVVGTCHPRPPRPRTRRVASPKGAVQWG